MCYQSALALARSDLCWSEGPKRFKISAGTDATEAHNKRIKKQAELNALSHGLVLEVPTNGSESLDGAIEEFLSDTKTTKKHKTYAVYKVSLKYFRESCCKQFVEQIDRRDMLRFIGFLREEKGLSPRSVYNKFEVVVTWLKANGVRGLVEGFSADFRLPIPKSPAK